MQTRQQEDRRRRRTVAGLSRKSDRLGRYPGRPSVPRPRRHNVLLSHLELLAQVVLEAYQDRGKWDLHRQ